jgi:hypothetical protein
VDGKVPSGEAAAPPTANRRTTRSKGAATSSTITKASTKNTSSLQPQKRPEIHLFSSNSRTAIEDDDDDVVEVSSPEQTSKARSKKRPLPDDNEADFATARGKRPSLRSLYDSDEDVIEVAKQVKKPLKNKGEASSKRTADAPRARGGRAGRAVARRGRVVGRVKSKVIITDSESEVEVPASDPTEAPLAPPPRPKPKPAYKNANSTASIADHVTTTTPTTTPAPSLPSTDAPTQPSLVATAETSLTTTIPVTSPSHGFTVFRDIPQVVPTTSRPYEENSIASSTSIPITSSTLPQTMTGSAIPPPPAIQGDFFEGGLLPPEGAVRPQSRLGWDPRLQYASPPMQRAPIRPRVFAGNRDTRPQLHLPDLYHNGAGASGEVGWDARGRYDDYRDGYRSQEGRRRGREDPGWEGGMREEYREVRYPGREDGGWSMDRMGGRYNNPHPLEPREMVREHPSREELAGYHGMHHTADYGEPWAPDNTYSDNALFNHGSRYLHPPPPPPPSRTSTTSTTPLSFPADPLQMESILPTAPST